MPLRPFLRSTGPGRGLLRIEGYKEPAESIGLTIQRNDGRYLGAGGEWQATPHWHPQFNAEFDDQGMQLELGASLMDGIIALHGQPLQLTLKLDGQEDRGVLRIRGSLIGSGAAADPTAQTGSVKLGPSVACEDNATALSSTRPGASSLDDNDEALLDNVDIEEITPRSSRRKRWPLVIAAGLAALLIGVGIAIGLHGWPPQLIGRKAAETQQNPTPDFLPSTETTLTGRAFALDFLAQGPLADGILAAAAARAEAGDCDAALILYARAVDTDPATGVDVARLYDPDHFVTGGCIDAANPDMALEYYRAAAEAGVPEAMRGAGRMLLERADSGPLYEEGREWIERADGRHRD